MKVPLAYGPIQKFLARIEQAPDLKGAPTLTLPRLSFDFTGLSYDPSRKVTQTQTFLTAPSSDKTKAKKVYMPVPYNMTFELNMIAKLNDDALQIVEQILPYFQPSYNLTINMLSTIGEKRDVPIVLDSVTFTDDYEGDFSERRALIYTMTFTAKTYLFGPVSSASKDIIKKATVHYTAGGAKATERDVTYSVTPRAIKDYTGDVLTNVNTDITNTNRVIEVVEGAQVTAEKYIQIGDEEIYVKSVTGNKLTVKRGQDGTTATEHLKGAEILGINKTGTEDNVLVEEGDDFGFSGTYT